MVAHAESTAPEECCGLAAGKSGLISAVAAVENVLHSNTEFRMEAGSQIREMVRIEKMGLKMLAIYHSHPLGPELPSKMDIDRFMYPESYSIILFPGDGEWSAKGFKMFKKSATEIAISIK